MSSDPVVSEVTPAIGNSSSKRPLDSECKPADVLPDNPSSVDSTTDDGVDEENPPKRIKVEGVEGAAAVEENPLNPVVSNDSVSTEAPPSEPTNAIKDEIDNGDTGAKDRSNCIAPTDTGTIDTGIGDVESQRGRTSESLNIFSPAVTRSRGTYREKENEDETIDSTQEEEARDSASSEKAKGRWRGKTHKMSLRLKRNQGFRISANLTEFGY